MFAVDIHAEGRDETIVCLVKHIEESFVEGQSSTQHGGNNHVIFGQRNRDGTQRSGHRLGFVF